MKYVQGAFSGVKLSRYEADLSANMEPSTRLICTRWARTCLSG